MSAYVPPTVIDYGNLTDLTAATDFVGPEDGAAKTHTPITPHHS